MDGCQKQLTKITHFPSQFNWVYIMRAASNVLLATSLLLLLSCSNKQDNASRLWAESRIYFEGGKVDNAIKTADDLRYYDASGSKFLIGQYMIYNGMVHGERFSGLEVFLTQLASIHVDNMSMYRGDYVAAKVFSQMNLEGDESARDLLNTECQKLMSVGPEKCVKYLIADSVERYMATPGHLDAVYIYESARIGGQLKLVDPSDSEFYKALSLVNNDNYRANAILRSLRERGDLNNSMEKVYCRLTRYVKVEEKAVDCFND